VALGRPAYFIDTSVLDEVLEVPGQVQHPEVLHEFKRRASAGDLMVIPITTLVEAGNHIAQCGGDRRSAAARYATLLDQLIGREAPWRVITVDWDLDFLRALRDGAHTGLDLVDLLHSKTLGGGDMAIFVEARRLLERSNGLAVGLWTKDAAMRAAWPYGNLIRVPS
jgi:hypothetical protein